MNAARKIVARQPVVSLEDACKSAWWFVARKCGDIPGAAIVLNELEAALGFRFGHHDDTRVNLGDDDARVDLAALTRVGIDDGDLPF